MAWNAAADDIFGFSEAAAGENDRIVLVSMLPSPRSRELFGARWAETAERMAAQFRAACDPEFAALVRRLRDGCPKFGTWWERHDVTVPRPAARPCITQTTRAWNWPSTRRSR